MAKSKSKTSISILLGVALIALGSLNTSCHRVRFRSNPPSNPGNPQNPLGLGPAAIDLSNSMGPGALGAAGSYVILAQTAITNVTGSVITGDVGISPAAASYITGFSLVADASNQFSTSVAVVGQVFAADYAPPTPANMTSATSNVQSAFVDGMGRTNPDHVELAAGLLGGLTLAPGLYNWSSNVNIATNLTLNGGANDVFIFQIAGNVDIAAAQQIILSGGVQAKNIFWVVAGAVTLGVTSHFEGIMLGMTAITMNTNASLNGRIFAQSAVNLDDNVITQP